MQSLIRNQIKCQKSEMSIIADDGSNGSSEGFPLKRIIL